MNNSPAKSENGQVQYMWEGEKNTYWALISYWIGTGYQNVEREVSHNVYEGWKIDNEQ